MDERDKKTMILWTRQVPQVWEELKTTGVYRVKEEYIRIKNDTIADFYIHLYHWYTNKARKYIDIPKELQRQGVKDGMELFSKPFYPLLRNRVQKSWERIFEIEHVDFQYIQGAVWCVKKEWVKEITVL